MTASRPGRYMRILAVELNLKASEGSSTSAADRLLAVADTGGGDEDTVVVVDILDKMNLGYILKKPVPVDRELQVRHCLSLVLLVPFLL